MGRIQTMQEAIKPTPTAEKMLTIISNRLHVKRDHLTPDRTWRELNVTETEKEDLIIYIAGKFGIPIGRGIVLGLHDGSGKIVKDKWENIIKKINTIWNVLQFVESNDDLNGRPSAYNIK